MKKKLTQRDYGQMWGEEGPYSQVRLCEETRILDDSVSRVFLVVEAEINPFTFEYIQKNRKKFETDEEVNQLLHHAEYRWKFGYVVSAGEVEIRDKESYDFAQKQKDMTIKTLIRMHRFVMDEYNLQGTNTFGVIEDSAPNAPRFMWDDSLGIVEEGTDMWDKETLVESPAGIKGDKIRFFIVFAFNKKINLKKDFKKESVNTFAKTLKEVTTKCNTHIEECEIFNEYVLVTALISFDIAPAEFIEKALNDCNTALKKPIFQKDYFVTNVKRPMPDEIMSFLKQLPLDKDVRMELF